MFRISISKNRFYDFRHYSIIYGRSSLGYKQMPDAFYNKKRKKLPPKIYTAISEAKMSFNDNLLRVLMSYQYKYELTIPSIIDKLQRKRLDAIKKAQMIPDEAIDELGIELCMAHLVVHMGGAIRLEGSDSWIGYSKDRTNLLPNTRMRNFQIEAVDLSGTLIMYEGLEYLPSLNKLIELKLSTTAFLNDHCLRRISRLRNRLEYLDISNCPQISGKGLETLWSLKNLKVLNVANNPTLEDKELVCLLLQDKIPQLQIQGVDYFAGLTSKQIGEILLLYNESKKQILSDSNENENNVNDESKSDDINSEDLEPKTEKII